MGLPGSSNDYGNATTCLQATLSDQVYTDTENCLDLCLDFDEMSW